MLKGHLHHGGVARDTGVIHHDVDLAKLGLNRRTGINAAFMVTHVPFLHRNSCTLRKRLCCGIIATVIGDDVPAFFLQLEANRLSNTSGSPGNHCNSSHTRSLTKQLLR